MSNNYDNNDWLKNNQPDDNGSDDDDLNIDWLKDADEEGSPSDTSRTGVTGQLSWLSGKHDSSPDAKGDDDDLTFDWQTGDKEDDSTDKGVGRTGVTGELSWRTDIEKRFEEELDKAEAAADEELTVPARESGSMLDRMRASLPDDEEREIPDHEEEPSGDTGLPSWLAGMEDQYADDEEELRPTNLFHDEDEDKEPVAYSLFDDNEGIDDEPALSFGTSADNDDDEVISFSKSAESENVFDLSFSAGDSEGIDDEPALSFGTSADNDDDEVISFSKSAESENVFDLSFSAGDSEGLLDDDVTDVAPTWLQGAPTENEFGLPEDEDKEPGRGAGSVPDWVLQMAGGDDDTTAEDEPESELKAEAPDWALGDVDEELTAEPEDEYAAITDNLFGDMGDVDEEFADLVVPTDDIIEDDFSFPEDLFADQPASEPAVPIDDFDLDALLGTNETTTIPAKPLPTTDSLLDDLLGEISSDLDEMFSTNVPNMPPTLQAPIGEDEDLGFDFGDEDDDESPVIEMDDDYVRRMMDKGDDSPTDWFAEDKDTSQDEPDWIGNLSDEQIAAKDHVIALPSDEDFLADLPEPAEDDMPTLVPADDLESLMASMNVDSEEIIRKSSRTVSNEELDDLFDTASREQIISRPMVTLSDDSPEWLRDVTISADEESASSLIRRQPDKPLDELDDRLQSLRERGLGIAQGTGMLSGSDVAALENLAGTLAPANIETVPEEIVRTLRITPEQAKHTNLLKSLVGEEVMAAALATEEDLPVTQRQRRLSPGIRPDRIVITLALAVAIILPFFNILQIGSLPATNFSVGTPGRIVFDTLEALQPGQLVLVAVEYGPTAASELDGAMDILLRHILLKGGRPVIVSTNAVALLRANNILDDIGAGQLNANRDYYVIRYLPGSALGLRNFGQNTADLLRFDVRGRETGLSNVNLNDFSLLLIIAERADDLRAWAEQILPISRSSVVAIIGYAAQPLVIPYLNNETRIVGLLVGYRDTYTYSDMLNRAAQGLPLESPTPIPLSPTLSPEPTEPETPTSEPTEVPVEVTAESTGEVQSSRTEEFTPTQEAQATVTSTTTPSTTPTYTATFTPTATPTSTNTPTPSPTPVTIGIVNSSSAVNVRETPNGAPVAVAQPNEEVIVIGQNEDGSWLNIRKLDGIEGWIASFLLTTEQRPFPPTPEADLKEPIILGRNLGPRTFHVSRDKAPRYRLQDEPTPEGSEEVTPAVETTAEQTFEPTVAPIRTMETPIITVPTLPPITSGVAIAIEPEVDRDERWYAMTLGTLMAIVVIAVGNLYNVFRRVFRRRGE